MCFTLATCLVPSPHWVNCYPVMEPGREPALRAGTAGGPECGVLGSDRLALDCLSWERKDQWTLPPLTGSRPRRRVVPRPPRSSGDSAPGCGPPGPSPAARPPSPGHCVLGPGVAQGWGPALGLWERIRGPLASPRCKLLIKGIPGMTEACVLGGLPACGMHPHAAQPTAGMALWHDPRPPPTREAPGLRSVGSLALRLGPRGRGRSRL